MKKIKRSYLEKQFERMLRFYSVPQPVREYTFHKFRFDFAWPKVKVCVEIDGGTFHGGSHVRGKGYQRDCIKNNLAQLEGWVVLRADREMVNTEEFSRTVKLMIRNRLHMKRFRKLPF